MSSLHAVIIDDNPHNIGVLNMLLTHQGLTYSGFESPQEVLSALEQLDQVDVVFLDLEFPIGDGFTLLKELRASPKLQGIPIIAYSVHTSEIDLVRRVGFDGFLGKPLDVQRFPQQLERILSGQKVWHV